MLRGSTRGADPFTSGDVASAPDRRLTQIEADIAQEEEGLLKQFRQTLPDYRAQIAAVAAVLAVIGVTIYWMYYTIMTKWVENTLHPTQTLTYETWTSLPALFGVAVVFNDASTSIERVKWRRVVPLFLPSNNKTVMYAGVKCEPIHVQVDMWFCYPTDAAGKSIFQPNADDNFSGASGRGNTLADHPMQYHSLGDKFCLSVDLYLDESDLIPAFTTPVISFAQFDGSATTSVQEVLAANLPGDDPRVNELFSRVTSPANVHLNTFVQLLFDASERIDVNGVVELQYDTVLVAAVNYNPLQVDIDKAHKPNSTDPTLTALDRILLEQLNADPKLTYYESEICMAPKTKVLRIVKESFTYNLLSFLSDFGGWLGIISLVLGILFPLAHSQIKARTVLILHLQRMWRNRQEKKQREAEKIKARQGGSGGEQPSGLEEHTRDSGAPASPTPAMEMKQRQDDAQI